MLKALRGNPGKRPLNLDDGLQVPVRVPDPPGWLNDDARVMWDFLTAQLLELGLVAEIDLGSVATYCQTWGDLCELERTWAALKAKAKEVNQGREAPAIMLTHIATTPSGIKRPSPLYERIRELRSDLDRMSRNFGGSPAARSRISPSSALDPDEGQATPAAGDAAAAPTVADGQSAPPAQGRPALSLVERGFVNFR